MIKIENIKTFGFDVCVDITAPLYWWMEFDAYKVGIAAVPCNAITMQEILSGKEFTMDDFSHEHLEDITAEDMALLGHDFPYYKAHIDMYSALLELNWFRSLYLAADKAMKKDGLSDSEREHAAAQREKFWWLIIQTLPISYNQKRSVILSYDDLSTVYHDRNNLKLSEWFGFCEMIKDLPWSGLITTKREDTELDAKSVARKLELISRVDIALKVLAACGGDNK